MTRLGGDEAGLLERLGSALVEDVGRSSLAEMMADAGPHRAPVGDRVAVRVGRRPEPSRSPRRRFARDLFCGAAMILVLHLYVVQISVVRGHSMRPSLCDGDRLVVDRLAYELADVDRFDVVVLRYPADPTIDFVKRVIGLPGDRVRIDRGTIYVNDVPIAEAFAHVADWAVMRECVVPANSYFVLGDNRPISCDSREFGVVGRELLKGRVRVCFWPLNRVAVF